MIVSLNEIEVNLRKAGTGAGLPYGLAEDLGRAAAWLAVSGFSSVALCVDALERLAAATVATPVFSKDEQGFWSATGADPSENQAMSSLYAGPAAGDLVCAAGAGKHPALQVDLAAIDNPLLFLAEVCALAPIRPDLSLRFICKTSGGDSVLAIWVGGEAMVAADTDRFDQACGMRLEILPVDDALNTQGLTKNDSYTERHRIAAEQGVEVSGLDWRRVQDLVAETLVPASELSRLQGAGAGLRDND